MSGKELEMVVTAGVRADVIAGVDAALVVDASSKAVANMSTVVCVGKNSDANGNVEGSVDVGMTVSVSTGLNTWENSGADALVHLGTDLETAVSATTEIGVCTSANANKKIRGCLNAHGSVGESTGMSENERLSAGVKAGVNEGINTGTNAGENGRLYTVPVRV